MYRIVQETWLTRMVTEYGNSALMSMTENLYSSGVYQISMLVFINVSFVSLALGLHRRSLSKRAVFAFMALCLLSPHERKPVAFRVVNGFSTALKRVFEKGVNEVISKQTHYNERSNMPPGLVLEMITAAASSKLKSIDARAALQGFVLNCLPSALRKDGEPASFDDLFNFKTEFVIDQLTNETVAVFKDAILDEKSLKNSDTFGGGKNCYEGLKKLRSLLVAELKDTPDHLTNRVLEDDGSDKKTFSRWLNKWKAKNTRFLKLSMNLKIAHVAAHERSKIIQNEGFSVNDPGGKWFSGTGTDASLKEMLSTMSYSTELGYRLSDFKNLISNTTESRWSFSLGAAIKDLKEKIELLPYNVSAIKLLLKFVLPFFLLTLFLGTFRFFFLWAGAWTVASLFPALISALRATHNSIITSKLGLSKMLEDSGHSALAYGVDLSLAKELLNDFVPLAYSMIEQENKVISVLSGLMLVGSWMAGGGANGFVSWVANSTQGALTSSILSRGSAGLGAKTLAPLSGAALAGPAGLLAAPLAAAAAERAVAAVRRSDVAKEFGKLFPRRLS